MPPADPGVGRESPGPTLRLPRSQGAQAVVGEGTDGATPTVHVSARSAGSAEAIRSQPVLVRAFEELRWTPEVVLYEGLQDGVETSVYVTAFEPGRGPRLHRHPYPEVFVVEEGRARFDVGGEQHEVGAGHFVVVGADTPHRYENVGPEPLKAVSVHLSGVVLQANL